MPHFPPIGTVCNCAYRAGSAPALSNKKRKASISEQRAQANGHLCPYPNQLWFRCFRLQFFPTRFSPLNARFLMVTCQDFGYRQHVLRDFHEPLSPIHRHFSQSLIRLCLATAALLCDDFLRAFNDFAFGEIRLRLFKFALQCPQLTEPCSSRLNNSLHPCPCQFSHDIRGHPGARRRLNRRGASIFREHHRRTRIALADGCHAFQERLPWKVSTNQKNIRTPRRYLMRQNCLRH